MELNLEATAATPAEVRLDGPFALSAGWAECYFLQRARRFSAQPIHGYSLFRPPEGGEVF